MSDRNNQNTSFNFETVGSVVAMLIGAVALFVAWDQAQVMRKQQHASVWPIVDSDLHIDGDEAMRFVKLTVTNAGVGPALIESATLLVDGEPVTTLGGLREKFLPESLRGEHGFGGSGIEGTVIAPGDEVIAMQLLWTNSDEVDVAFANFARSFIGANAKQLTLSICYCSVFDKCWQTQVDTRATPVSSCPAATGYLQNFVDSSESADP